INFYATYMGQIVFRGVISSAGSEKYGEKRYAMYIPKSVKEKRFDKHTASAYIVKGIRSNQK
ncbi:MAG: hypothetical protein ACPL1B_02930, partial [Thermoprotei archaeon]